MKRYIKSSQASLFPNEGSAPEANKRGGLFTFGKNQVITLDNGGQFKLVTPKVMFDSSTGETIVSLNVYVGVAVHTLPKEEQASLVFDASFYRYTPEEVEKLYDTVRAMSEDELKDFIRLYNKRV